MPNPLELINRAGIEARALTALLRAGAIGGSSPAKTVAILKTLRAFGPFGSAVHLAAIRHPDSPAIADERGELTYLEFDELINRLANALLARGLQQGDGIAMLCKNHRAPLLIGFAASRAGLRSLWLNTSFSARQATEVCAREGVDLLIHDAEFTELLADVTPPHGKFAIDVAAGGDDLDALIAEGSPDLPPAPAKPGRIVLLTSGTTGTPKGAPRADPKGFAIPGGVLERMPMRSGESTVMGPPLFHGTGLLLATLAISVGNKLVLRTKFDPRQMLADIDTHRASTICVVPVMLQRMVELGPDVLAEYDTRSLKCAFTAGSQLPAALSKQFSDQVGDVIYNLYGSTEVSVATIATPVDVREAPTSVGRPTLGVRIKILGDNGQVLPQGETGRIFVGTTSPFEGYTGGGGKDVIDGLMATGDVGHFDAQGRLYIDGRDDEMIVSGGENVFPREVEELLVTHPAIADAAVLGAEDESFGQRLRAFVVLRPGETLEVVEVQDFVKDNLARYKSPRDVLFLDELPRNPTGKVLKRELAQL
ncbi:acyl-CoA synthetase [Nocardioides marmoriginsengisoli]|uniref:Acyl-CoA synthetase n=1 Tax=Nocardioides marmoriginsengisoli TaxID=661483 RepID=A0A3N0CGJ4_9ACTN|nr:AMP-binding protein [Nocardioides marmoriginsengisoli]RNL62558.1 acyl-CoA synthetase [Nocardioides marmoriginsengisoli]